jgi:hypothetical protein
MLGGYLVWRVTKVWFWFQSINIKLKLGLIFGTRFLVFSKKIEIKIFEKKKKGIKPRAN